MTTTMPYISSPIGQPIMFRDTLYVSRPFRDLVLDTYPALRTNTHYRALFAYLLFPSKVDDETGLPVLDELTLATLADQLQLLKQNHFKGGEFIARYREDVGHDVKVSKYSHVAGRARAVTDLNLAPALAEALDAELRTPLPSAQGVAFVSGLKRTRQHDSNARKADLAQTMLATTPYRVASEAITYLNTGVSKRLSSDAVQAHYEEAYAVALQGDNLIGRRQNLLTLRWMLIQPQQFYTASRLGRTCRIFPAHYGLNTLSREVAQVLGKGWITCDLRSSQLAIAAFLWNVPAMITFLRSGKNIWDELGSAFGEKRPAKRRLKDGVYALTYGGARPRICWSLNEDQGRFAYDEPLDAATLALGACLLTHPLMQAMYQARQHELDTIRLAGGAWDCFGHWISMPMDPHPRYPHQKTPNPRSVLAQVAQAAELKILAPVFVLARAGKDFRITRWAHDGFSIHIREKRRVKQVCARIEDAVRISAASLGVETHLERTLFTG
jgi:hypothetical protein